MQSGSFFWAGLWFSFPCVLCAIQQDSLDLLSASALAQLSAQSNAIYSPSAIQMVFRVVGSKEEPLNYLGTYLDEFNALVLKVRHPSKCKNPLGIPYATAPRFGLGPEEPEATAELADEPERGFL